MKINTMVLKFIKNILCKNFGWFCPHPEKTALEILEKTLYTLEDRYKDHALTKKYEYLKSTNADIETIKKNIDEGVQRLEVHEKWNFYEDLIKSSGTKPETESDLKDVIYNAKIRRIVFEIYQNKCERGIIKDEQKEELERYMRKQAAENKKLIRELIDYKIYNRLQGMWRELLNTELDRLNKFISEYNNLEECKVELINQNNRLNSLKYCANDYITDVKLEGRYKIVKRFLEDVNITETNLNNEVSDILKPLFEEVKGKIDYNIASILNEEITRIFCERLNKDRLMR